MKTEYIILISFAAAFAWFIIGAIVYNLPPKGERISCIVTSAATGEPYEADRYYIDKEYTPNLRIWNPYTARYEWYPVWQFKKPLVVMAQIDPEYTKENLTKLIGAQSVSLWRKEQDNDRK